VFLAQRDAGGNGIYGISNGVVTELVAGATSQFSLLGAPNINDNGVVFFFSNLDNGGRGMYRIEGGVLSTIADSDGPFAFFGGPTAINDTEIAFFARMDAGWSGIFTGGDPDNDLVIRTGDTLFGRTLSQLDLWENGLTRVARLRSAPASPTAAAPSCWPRRQRRHRCPSRAASRSWCWP
jgi:hypothetical protein